MDREIEIKIQLASQEHSKLLAWLEANAKFRTENRQVDTYYNNPKQPFTFLKDGYKDAEDYLRIRKSEKGNSICFKHWVKDPEDQTKHLYCDEYETEVDDTMQMHKILDALGYKKDIVIDKTRRVYEYQYFEFAIDQVKELGNFVEIEIKQEMDPREGHQKIYKILKQMGIKQIKILQRGYVSMIWNKEHDFAENKSLI